MRMSFERPAYLGEEFYHISEEQGSRFGSVDIFDEGDVCGIYDEEACYKYAQEPAASIWFRYDSVARPVACSRR